MPRLSIGIEYNPHAEEETVGPLVNLVALTETRRRPALILGTSSDRIGTPEGQAYFATLSKNLEPLTGWPVAPYVGLSYGTFENELEAIGGLRTRLGRRLSSTIIWDGENLHPTLELTAGRHVVTLLWVDAEEPGIAYSSTF